MDKRINHNRIKILLKNGYNEIDIENQTLFQPDGTQKKIPQFEVARYKAILKHKSFFHK